MPCCRTPSSAAWRRSLFATTSWSSQTRSTVTCLASCTPATAAAAACMSAWPATRWIRCYGPSTSRSLPARSAAATSPTCPRRRSICSTTAASPTSRVPGLAESWPTRRSPPTTNGSSGCSSRRSAGRRRRRNSSARGPCSRAPSRRPPTSRPAWRRSGRKRIHSLGTSPTCSPRPAPAGWQRMPPRKPAPRRQSR